METKVFTVTGMKCEHCEANVENALKALVGVETAKADHNADCVSVTYDEAVVTPDDFKDAVDAAGRYEMTK